MDVKELIVLENFPLRKGLEVLNSAGLGTVFVTSNNGKLTGILTDGDVRRALLNGISITDPVSSIMNTNFVSLPFDADNSKILETLSNKIKIIPLVNDEQELVDYATTNRIRRIMVAAPYLNGNELAYVTDCIKTNWISSQGKYVRKFEELFTSHHNGMPSLAVSNGTVALHLALEALKIGKGDEVLVPDLTFAASINAVLYTGATPVLVDIDKDTWTIDVAEAEKLISPRTKAIMPVHLYGHPCDMDAIMSLAKKYNLYVIEDCAEAIGSYYKGKPVGTFGDASTYSFFGNKTVTTGEGGMVVFKESSVAERASILRDHGMEKNRRYWHQEVGYNYRMTNLQAAVGVAQFERLQEFVEAKRRIAKEYSKALSKTSFFVLPKEKEWAVSSYWLYTFLVKEDSPFSRDELITYLSTQGIESRPVFYCLHEMPPYRSFGNASLFKISKFTSITGISLPSSVNLSELEINLINKTITSFVSKFV